MARSYLEAICTVRRISNAKIYSPTAANRVLFTQEMTLASALKLFRSAAREMRYEAQTFSPAALSVVGIKERATIPRVSNKT
jgi:hypothetical protein